MMAGMATAQATAPAIRARSAGSVPSISSSSLTAGSPSCAPYVCDGSGAACPGTCAVDAGCASGYTCKNAACVLKSSLGATCQTANQCQSGQCLSDPDGGSICTPNCEEQLDGGF